MKRRLLLVLLAAIGAATSPIAGQTPAPRAAAEAEQGTGVSAPAAPAAGKPAQLPPLPEIAVEATRLGLEAAARKDWPEAIRHFREARAAAPEDPAVLYRLALAHDRAGHGLPAIAWFRAFLAVAPQANNGPLVRERIAELEKANQEEAYQLALVDFRVAGGVLSPEVAYLLARSGHRDEAERLLEKLGQTPGELDSATIVVFNAIAEGLCELGNYRDAREIAGRFPENDIVHHRERLMLKTIRSQALQGDSEEALAFLSSQQIKDLNEKSRMLLEVADELAADARPREALRVLADVYFVMLCDSGGGFTLANTLAQLGGDDIQAFVTNNERAYAVVRALAYWGYLNEAESVAGRFRDANWRFLADLEILQAQVVFKQITLEKQVHEIERRMTDLTDGAVKNRGYQALATAHLALKNIAAAEQAKSGMKYDEASSTIGFWLSQIRSQAAKDTETPNTEARSQPARFHRLSELQRSIGDVEGAEQTLRMSAVYSPLAEAADWSATALRLERRNVCVDPAREYLEMASRNARDYPVLNLGGFRANQLLEIQFDLRDRAARRQRQRERASGVPATSRN